MSDSTNAVLSLGRAAVLAVLTWLVLAARLAVAVTNQRPMALVGPEATPAMRQQLSEMLDVGFLEAFVAVLTFDFGPSFVTARGETALGLVGSRLGRTLLLVVLAVTVAAAVAAPLVLLARRSGGSTRGLRAAGYLGAVPAVGWLTLLLVAARGTPLPSIRSGPVDVLVPAVALGIPLAAAGLRAATRGERNGGAVVDAWLWGSWLVGAVVAVDVAFAVGGVGDLLVSALLQADVPVVAAAVVVLSLPLVLAGPLRDLAWALGGGSEQTVRADGGVAETDDQAAADSPEPAPTASARGLPAVLRSDRRVQGGLVAFGALLVGGVAGAVLLSPPRLPGRRVLVPAALLADLGAATLFAGLAATVGAVVGVPLGLAGGRSRVAGSLARVVDVATNVPLVVLALLVLGLSGPSGGLLDGDLLVGVAAGLALAPLVLRTTERAFARTGDDAVAAAPGAGVAATGGAVVAFLVAQLDLVGLSLSSLGATAGGVPAARHAVETLVPVALPALALLVVGERLRGQH